MLPGVAGICKTRISKQLSLLCLAQCCTVLRSRWCQSGVKRCQKFGRSHDLPPQQGTQKCHPRYSVLVTVGDLAPFQLALFASGLSWPRTINYGKRLRPT